ncbi:pentapeptide repeat-containing protein [Streptomyces sp. AV19]|uniref:pentapeptide repeat-containing protein n=1 Tax=Streptomyces sp. AV19 TaxID=2793068 RepID=UPI0018FE6F53|nr:pentapeptide repeat-containing protein [Streptomyces sp. AV19]MBH1937264.1 pentapeptide repeat-containing protein [Streptomyces sp. AV19]MDG4536742.1 pentapeptide repeat-containing protein [Streptomyces sp. AV19]
MRARAPRDLAALPFAHRLQPFTGEIEHAGNYEWLHFDGSVLEDADGGSSLFSESAFSSATFDGGRYRRSRFDDVWLHNVRMVGTNLAETRWLDGECIGGVLAGVEIHGAEMYRTVFHQCKFDSVNLRATLLKDVVFVDCLLRDVDFGGATLTDVSFPGSTLDGARFDRATLTRVDLREAGALCIASGLEGMKGATISTTQLFDLAPALAQYVGLTVKDH